jgi:hypothetical protein
MKRNIVFRIWGPVVIPMKVAPKYIPMGVAPKRKIFLGNHFVHPNHKYQLKNKYPPLAKNRYKRIPFSCHICSLPLLWYKFDNCLCNFLQSKVSCCLHMYFLWRHHLPPDKSENDQDSDSDWFTYCIDIWLMTLLFSLQYLSESYFGNDNKIYYPTLELFCFSFTQPFTLTLTQNFVYPTLFSSALPPAIINNDQSLGGVRQHVPCDSNF